MLPGIFVLGMMNGASVWTILSGFGIFFLIAAPALWLLWFLTKR